MKKHAKKTVYIIAPVEQTWRLLTGGSDTRIDPLDEEGYSNTEPEKGTVYTRATEIVQNEKFSFQIKTRQLYEDWSITLEPAEHFETKLTVQNTVTYRSLPFFIFSQFWHSAKREVQVFINDLKEKVAKEQNGN